MFQPNLDRSLEKSWLPVRGHINNKELTAFPVEMSETVHKSSSCYAYLFNTEVRFQRFVLLFIFTLLTGK